VTAGEVLLEEGGIRLRRATGFDVAFLAGLAAEPEVAPFLAAVGPYSATEIAEEVERSLDAPAEHGRIVVELDEEGTWRRAGALAYEVANRRSRIAYLHAVVVAPAYRRRGIASRASRLVALYLIREHGYHRVQLEVYGFNEAAARAFERAGFVCEGRRRSAYWRHDAWQDGVLFGLLAEDVR
jgi:RimJ/RimL family protein N-acetyltransferase